MSFYDSIKLEKGMYKGEGFTKTLEKLDPSENYENTELAGLDAFGRQLKRFDIKVSGPNSDIVEKFFRTSDSAVLFPEYISRAVKQGMEEANVLPEIIATTTKIEGMDYRTITSTISDNSGELNDIAECAAIPEITVKTQDNLVQLHKRGRMLVSSYEALRFQHLDVFTIILKQIGSYIASAQLDDAIDVLLNGDGNNNAAGSVTKVSSTGLAYGDLVTLWASLSPYKLTTILGNSNSLKAILNINEMKDANAGLNFHGTGNLVTPAGANLIHVPNFTSDKIIGIDKNCALEMVQASDIIIDNDKLIDRQLERTCVSAIAGFAKIFNSATKSMEI